MKWNQKCKIPHTALERRTSCFNSYKNRKFKKNCDVLELAKEKRGHFRYRLFSPTEIFLKSDFHFPKKVFYLLDLKPFKNYEKCFLLLLKSFFRSQNI